MARARFVVDGNFLHNSLFGDWDQGELLECIADLGEPFTNYYVQCLGYFSMWIYLVYSNGHELLTAKDKKPLLTDETAAKLLDRIEKEFK